VKGHSLAKSDGWDKLACMTLEQFKAEVRAASPEVREELFTMLGTLRREGNPSGASSGLPPSPNETDLKSSLLAAVSKPTRPYRRGEFVELARHVIAEDRSA
jgi:hypothetical protein